MFAAAAAGIDDILAVGHGGGGRLGKSGKSNVSRSDVDCRRICVRLFSLQGKNQSQHCNKKKSN